MKNAVSPAKEKQRQIADKVDPAAWMPANSRHTEGGSVGAARKALH